MDRFTLNSQMEHLQLKHVGTGHADTTKKEWLTNQHRDTLSSIIGNSHLLRFVAVSERQSLARTKFNLKSRMSTTQ